MAKPSRSEDPIPAPSGDPPKPRPSQGPADMLFRALAFERHALKEVLRENRRLREMSAEMLRSLREIAGPDLPAPEGEGEGGWPSLVRAFISRIRERQGRAEEAQKRNALLKRENGDLLARCQELLKENDNLFKLYVASRHLHSSLYLGEVVGIVSEIVLDIIGAGDHAIFLHDERSRALVPVLVKGLEGLNLKRVPIGTGPVGQVVAGDSAYTACDPLEDGSISLDRPLAVISLKTSERLIGAIVIYRLLSQKPSFTDIDYTLFDFFAAHAATAIHSAKLYGESERKVSQMKEFLKVMQPPKPAGPEEQG